MPTTLAQLRLEARQRADMENDDFVEDPELDTYINDSRSELYDLLVSTYADYFIEDPLLITLALGESTYPLPSNFYKLIGMDRCINEQGGVDGDNFYTIRPFNWEDRNNRRNVDLFRGLYPNMRYRILGNNFKFMPQDQAQGIYRVWYVPSVPTLTADADELDVNCDRWKIYIVVDVAIKMLQKEESDVSVLAAQKSALIRRVEEMAQVRDAGEPERVTDVTWGGGDYPLYYR